MQVTTYAMEYTLPHHRCFALPFRANISGKNAAMATTDAAVCGQPRNERWSSMKFDIISSCFDAEFLSIRKSGGSITCHSADMTFVMPARSYLYIEVRIVGDGKLEN